MTPQPRTAGSSPSTDSCPDDAGRVRPFDSGTQYTAWLSRNCFGCSKFDAARFRGRCDIDGALGDAYFGDGTVSQEIADRMGYTAAQEIADRMGYTAAQEIADGEFPWTWTCPEREQVSR